MVAVISEHGTRLELLRRRISPEDRQEIVRRVAHQREEPVHAALLGEKARALRTEQDGEHAEDTRNAKHGQDGCDGAAYGIQNQITDSFWREPFFPRELLGAVQVLIDRRLDLETALLAHRVVDLVDGRSDYELHLTAGAHHANYLRYGIQLVIVCKPFVFQDKAQARHAMGRARYVRLATHLFDNPLSKFLIIRHCSSSYAA